MLSVPVVTLSSEKLAKALSGLKNLVGQDLNKF